MPGKELFVRFTAHAFRKLLSIYVFSHFPFGFEGRIWDLIVSVPHHCLSFYFVQFIHNLCENLDGAHNRRHKQTDLIIMDFAKAFDNVPHRRLAYKLEYYVIWRGGGKAGVAYAGGGVRRHPTSWANYFKIMQFFTRILSLHP